ncbi:hypothetical protein GCM10027519_15670 [Kineococcus endophyticus]
MRGEGDGLAVGEGGDGLAQGVGQFRWQRGPASANLQRQQRLGLRSEEFSEFSETFEAGSDGDLGAVAGDGRRHRPTVAGFLPNRTERKSGLRCENRPAPDS